MSYSTVHMLVMFVCITTLIVQYKGETDPKNGLVDSVKRPGRCPHPRYAFSGFRCSTEENDSVCPRNYKCCPLSQGMRCFAPCPEWSSPCNLNCTFGLKVNPSPCTVCECAEDPCLKRTCDHDTTCKVIPYLPCAFPNKCGFSSECVPNPNKEKTIALPKPNRCPPFWPDLRIGGANRLRSCTDSDSECPGDQKCCKSPLSTGARRTSDGRIELARSNHYCIDPCPDLSQCQLNCTLGLRVEGLCFICECNPDRCLTMSCPPGKDCQQSPVSCAHYPGSPPCRLRFECQ